MFNIKDLPPIERKPDGSLPHMTPRQRAQANALIRRECSYYDDGNCLYCRLLPEVGRIFVSL